MLVDSQCVVVDNELCKHIPNYDCLKDTLIFRHVLEYFKQIPL